MKVRLLTSPPALLFYTDRLPDGVGGCTNGPVVRIRPKYRDDAGIHKHEELHVWQWWLTLGLHSLLYLFIRPYRQWAEVEAYRRQMRYPPHLSLDSAAQRLAAPRYELGLTADQAREALIRS